MSIEGNKSAIQRFWDEVFNKGNLDVADELCTSDYVYHGPGDHELRGSNELKTLVKALRIHFPDLNVMVEDMVAEDEKVAHRWTMQGTHKDTKKRLINKGMIITRFVDGKVAEDWELFDRLHGAEQLASGWLQKVIVNGIVKQIKKVMTVPDKA
jgi:steroid delta-isomerase-like uncharacterized protein